MTWGAVIGAGVGLVGSMYSSSKSSKAADKAADREEAAAGQALARQEEAFEEAKVSLQPYARQEAAASSQMMRQLGLGGGGGGGAAMGGDPWGFDQSFEGAFQDESMDRFLEDLLANETAVALRAGYRGKHGQDGVIEGARRAQGILRDLKSQGRIPGDFEIPSLEGLQEAGWGALATHGGHKALRRSGWEAPTNDLVSTYFDPETGQSRARMEYDAEREQMMADAPPAAGGATMGSGPGGAFTAGDIMGMAGVEQLPGEIQDRYYADLMEDPRTDPELAAYLGLTEESLQVGDSYQQTPAYMAAREAGVEAVDASAAAGGGLYSGRRGKALRDVGQDVEQQYYMDAMNRRQQMMADRRGERTAGIGRRGVEVAGERGREQSYYNNYMQMLSAMSSPSTTTNIAQMGTSLGKDAAANIVGTARNIGDLEIGAAGAQGAAIADVTGGAMDLASTWIENRPEGGYT